MPKLGSLKALTELFMDRVTFALETYGKDWSNVEVKAIMDEDPPALGTYGMDWSYVEVEGIMDGETSAPKCYHGIGHLGK